MTEFSYDDYRLAGHLKPWYKFYSGLDIADLAVNPYGWSDNPIDDIGTSYATAKAITRLYLENLKEKPPG